MAVPKRMPDNILHALEDIIQLCLEARCEWRDAMDHAEKQMDPIQLMALANLSDVIARIETKARAAFNGHYQQ